MSIPARTLRVFLSSTFRDMRAEREELIKQVFPALRKLCAERGVTWGDVDLRWGVTEEQTRHGRVLPICLAEIDRCRPFFICLLGERYGWVPTPASVSAELRTMYPWIEQHLNDSVTEMEVWHGALNDCGRQARAFFYFRDPAYVDRIPPGEDPSDYAPEDPAARDKLKALKRQIRESGYPVSENYQDAGDLGRRVLADLTALIDRLFPAGSVPHPLDREKAEHEAFARGRRHIYVSRPDDFRHLDAYAESVDPCGLVVTGESGVGKSALLANWLPHYAADHPGEFTLYHATGATPRSADGQSMLRRLLGEMRRRVGLEVEAPVRPATLQRIFANALHAVADQCKVVLVLDGLNQLEDRDGFPDLPWLPARLPATLRVIASALPGRSLDELTARQWPQLAVQPLTLEERRELIMVVLTAAGKALDSARSERVALAQQTANPLFLRILLEEFRVFGSHEMLDEQIDYYLAAASPDDLFIRVLRRYEQDYEGDKPGLVGDAMALLWASRRGLSEAELLDVLGDPPYNSPLPQAFWSPLYLAAEHALLNASGRLIFSHKYMRRAVQDRYLSDKPSQRAAHLQLASYFDARSMDRRKAEEFPWQLARAGEWQPLADWLSHPFNLVSAWALNEFDVRTYWADIERHTTISLTDSYQPILDEPEAHPDQLSDPLISLLMETGHPEEALALQGKLIARDPNDEDKTTAYRLGNQAGLLRSLGRLDEALAFLDRQEAVWRRRGDQHRLAICLGNRAIILRRLGDSDRAMELLRHKEEICEQADDLLGLVTCLGNQADILRERGDLNGAFELLRRVERLARQMGDPDSLQQCYAAQGTLLQGQGAWEAAADRLRRAEEICRSLNDVDGLARCLDKQAELAFERGDLLTAGQLLAEAGALFRKLNEPHAALHNLINQAHVLALQAGRLSGEDRTEEATERFGQAQQIYDEIADSDEMIGYLKMNPNLHDPSVMRRRILVTHLAKRGNLTEALAFVKQIAQDVADDGSDLSLCSSVSLQASYLRNEFRRPEEALPLAELAYALAVRLDHPELITVTESERRMTRRAALDSLGRRATELARRGELDDALRLRRQGENLCREWEDLAGLAESLGSQGLILIQRDQLEEAAPLLEQAEALFRQAEDSERAYNVLETLLKLQIKRNDSGGAFEVLERQRDLSVQMADPARETAALVNMSGVLLQGPTEVLPMAVQILAEAARLVAEHRLDALEQSVADRIRQVSLRISEHTMAQARHAISRGDYDEAIAALRVQEQLARQVGAVSVIAVSLFNQARLLAQNDDYVQTALMCAEEALRMAEHYGLTTLAEQIEPLVVLLRDKEPKPE